MIRQTCIGFLLLILGSVLAPAQAESLAEYALGDGITLRLEAGGDLVLGATTPDGDWSPLLTCSWPEPAVRRSVPTQVFVGTAREGDQGGRRGFTRDADDDADGDVDEDPLDGRDNDGDGAVDEDFAAVSDAMTVWDQVRAGRERHLETYHWTYPHLARLVAAAFTQRNGCPCDPLELTLHGASAWRQVDAAVPSPEAGVQDPIFLARTTSATDASAELWFGVVILDTDERRHAGERVRADADRLTVPLSSERQELALAAGPTCAQVVNDLLAAARLQTGAVDPVSGQTVAWLPPAVPTEIPAGRRPTASVRAESAGGFTLLLAAERDQILRFDPDLFRLDHQSLGSPDLLIWRPVIGPAASLSWPPALDDPAVYAPYAVLDVAAAGTMEYFYGAGEPSGTALSAVHVDGRRVELPATRTAVSDSIPTPAAALAPGESSQGPRLSPRLLSNYPNPFRTTTRVTFKVPATAEEAFVWDDATTIDPQMRLPYVGGSANVSVTVYGLEGREVASLFAGSVGVGIYEAQWNGRDRQGRTVASGAYFCKLQIEQWTTAKRLIFVR